MDIRQLNYFIAVAEETGLIVPIGEWVIREALRQAREWQLAGRPVRISINVSAKQLARSTFVERLRRNVPTQKVVMYNPPVDEAYDPPAVFGDIRFVRDQHHGAAFGGQGE